MARVLQLGVLVATLMIFGPFWGIAGVALAVDLMLLAGMVYLFWHVREYVDFSLRALFVIPGIGLLAGIVLARLGIMFPGVLGSDWRTGVTKIAIFTFIYGGLLFVFERQNLTKLVEWVKSTYNVSGLKFQQ